MHSFVVLFPKIRSSFGRGRFKGFAASLCFSVVSSPQGVLEISTRSRREPKGAQKEEKLANWARDFGECYHSLLAIYMRQWHALTHLYVYAVHMYVRISVCVLCLCVCVLELLVG